MRRFNLFAQNKLSYSILIGHDCKIVSKREKLNVFLWANKRKNLQMPSHLFNV